MKNLIIYDHLGAELFKGTRHDAKQFIKANKLKRYTLKEVYQEKVMLSEEEKFNEIFA